MDPLAILKKRQDDMAAISQFLDLIEKSKGLIASIAGAVSCLPLVFGGFGMQSFREIGDVNQNLPDGLRFFIFIPVVICAGFTFTFLVDWLEHFKSEAKNFVIVMLSLVTGYLIASLSYWASGWRSVENMADFFPVFVAGGLVILMWFVRLRFQRVLCVSEAKRTARAQALFWIPISAVIFATLMILGR